MQTKQRTCWKKTYTRLLNELSESRLRIAELVSKLKDKELKIERGWRGTMEDKMTLGLIEIEATIPAM